MRGKALYGRSVPCDIGITPAYAGKSCCPRSRSQACRDHPRVCGEKNDPVMSRVLCRGSPPRMRGKEDRCAAAWSGRGITPAYAGKSWIPDCTSRCSGDHPRVCGEKSICISTALVVTGSPPRMRGKVFPEDAGDPPKWDHPRVCGEKTFFLLLRAGWAGSPPRMRGKVDAGLYKLSAFRITPAYAGKSMTVTYDLLSNADHPRVCGEKSSPLPTPPPRLGSPPRMRGKD